MSQKKCPRFFHEFTENHPTGESGQKMKYIWFELLSFHKKRKLRFRKKYDHFGGYPKFYVCRILFKKQGVSLYLGRILSFYPICMI